MNTKLTNYDSDFCGNLPIYLTNIIQPYGVLLAIDRQSFEIVQASENTVDVFGKPVAQVVGTKLPVWLSADNVQRLNEKLQQPFNSSIPATWTINDQNFLVLIHSKEKHLLVEIDCKAIDGMRDSFVDVYQDLKFAISNIESTTTLEAACAEAARELKRISGFDKVMIYSFDSDWNGTVIAEEREKDMESYMGFTFPASDIPKQARQLYLKNPFRFIPDRNYVPVKLYPVVNPITGAFLDISDCNLRSVAAVHLEYLKNMGVTASMSTRILHNGELWGLIACHHKTPKYMSYEMCSVFEMLSNIISVKITSLKSQVTHDLQNNITLSYSKLIESIYRTNDLQKNLLSESGILKLFSASGAAIARDGKFIKIGHTPANDQLEELVLWLHTRQLKNVFYTDSLASENEEAAEYSAIASGMLVIPINSQKDYYIIIFRPEQVRVINWGGNPDERIQFDKDEKNYHPRNSFKQWQQKVSGISLPWVKEEIEKAQNLRSFIYEFETSTVL